MHILCQPLYYCHRVLTCSPNASFLFDILTQFSPQLQNGLEESTNAEVIIPLNDISGKQANPQEDDVNGIPNKYHGPTSKPVAKAVHRTNEHNQHITGKRDIDNEGKVFKKPDKILPCPRCNSLETKFCYFNNYNVNQPRHFCKNCQRYWTAGGTIRNVPVGAGKRKNKHLDSNTSSDKHLSSSMLSVGNITSLKEEVPLSVSLETMLNLKGHGKFEVESPTVKDDSEEHSENVRDAESNENDYSENGIEQVGLTQHCNDGLIPLHPLHYYPAPPWSYQWNPCWNALALRPGDITSNPAYMDSATMIGVPGFSNHGWSCMPSWIGQNEEFSAFTGLPSPSSSVSSGSCSGYKSPTLGKHCRDGTTLEEDTTKPNLWIPKTLRINDPEEAAKSSIWSTLGIKSEQNKPILKGSVFKSFEPKSNASSDDDQILRANPAAFSRSESFQESM